MIAALSWPARHPFRATAIAIILAILSALGATRLRPDTSLQSLFSANDRAAASLNRVLNNFSAAEEMLVLVTTPGTQPHPDQLLSFAQRLESSIAQDPKANPLISSVTYRPDDQTREYFTKIVVPNGLFYLSETEFAAARHRLTRGEMAKQLHQNEAMLAAPGPAASAISKLLLKDPLRLREFMEQRLAASNPFKTYQNSDAMLSEDGRSLLIRIAGTGSPSDLEFCHHITDAVAAVATRVNADHLTVELSGAYPIAAQSERSIRHDSILSVNGSILCLAALFVLAFRRPLRLFATTFAPVAIGILYGFGIFSLISRTVTPLTAVIGAMLAGIGIDYAIFYLVHYQERRAAGAAPAEAATDALRTIGGALFAAWVTSVVGFIAIGFASVRALRDFSIVGSLGLAGALIGAMFLLPALLVILDRFARSKSSTRSTSSPIRISNRPLLNWIDRRAERCLAVSSILLIAIVTWLAIVGPWLSLESDPTVLHPRPNPPLDSQAHIAERMKYPADPLIIHLQADSPKRLLDLAHRVNDRLATPQAHNAGVTATFGLATLLPDPASTTKRLSEVGTPLADQVTTDFDAAIADSAFDPKAYVPYKDFLRAILTQKSAPGIADLIPYGPLARIFLPRQAFTGQPAQEAITFVILDPSLHARSAQRDCITQLRTLLTDLPGATLTGMAILSLDTEATIHRDLPKLIAAAVIIIAVYLLLHFRSPAHALLAVLPTLCSLACLLAVAKIAGAKMNLANIVSIPLLIGIDVDYGIFLVSVARRSRSRAELREQAAASSHAVVLCAASTLLGFGSLAFTSVPAVRSLGWAVAIGVTVCAAASLFLLLPLLLWLQGRRDQRAHLSRATNNNESTLAPQVPQ